MVTGRPIKEVPFDYEFAAFEPAERSEARLAIDALRARIGGLADSALATSADGLESLRKLGSTEVDAQAFDRMLHALGAGDVKRLRRYVGARTRLASRTPRKAVARLRIAGAAIWSGLVGTEDR